mmetsp:Transcript_6545/g.10970  ORF Transcript_6545/g.10970 Transcript_6545/m.10970 type:complete len:268 (+) Transcript_6545:395-1198(+)
MTTLVVRISPSCSAHLSEAEVASPVVLEAEEGDTGFFFQDRMAPVDTLPAPVGAAGGAADTEAARRASLKNSCPDIVQPTNTPCAYVPTPTASCSVDAAATSLLSPSLLASAAATAPSRICTLHEYVCCVVEAPVIAVLLLLLLLLLLDIIVEGGIVNSGYEQSPTAAPDAAARASADGIITGTHFFGVRSGRTCCCWSSSCSSSSSSSPSSSSSLLVSATLTLVRVVSMVSKTCTSACNLGVTFSIFLPLSVSHRYFSSARSTSAF